MEDNIAIRIRGLSKKYNISEKKIGLSFLEKIKELLLTFISKKKIKDPGFYALKDISLEIKKGECVGIIGRNGAGKSTLLKILSEVVEPTEGTIEINGSMASVLEVGMGFHPELTGRENVYLSGAMMGIPKWQMSDKIKSIIEFSGVENFIDTPVKYYSSGMYLRLAFSVVSNLDADIMLFDETLSTGDINFQLKCYEIIDTLVSKGKTILLVSHNLNDIIKISSRIVYLDNGMLKSDSQSNSLDAYLKDSLSNNSLFNSNLTGSITPYIDKKTVQFNTSDNSFANEDIQLKKIQICAVNKTIEDDILTSDEIVLSIEYYKIKDSDFFNIGFTFIYLNSVIIYAHSLNSDLNTEQFIAKGDYIAKLRIPPYFFNDVNLQVSVNITKNNTEIIYAYKKFLHFKLGQLLKNNEEFPFKDLTLSKYRGPVFPQWHWEILH